MIRPTIAVHGGAGTILRNMMSPEKEAAFKLALENGILAGSNVLEKGGSAIDAVEAAIMVLEDDPLFNAGRGSVFTHEGRNEMDASIMDGSSMGAGAVTGVKNVRNPIRLARAVMEQTSHVLLCGSGAEEFARSINLPFEPDEYFFVQHRFDQLQLIRESSQTQMDHTAEKKFGTVGAVALDAKGNLAAGTSTGGMTNKRYGRAGDTPVIGAGTYANNATCAISCTGHGEFFIRGVVGHDISCLMEYKGLSLKEACEMVVYKKLPSLGGEGGVIALDLAGNVELVFNSEGMYRGMKRSGEDMHISIYKDGPDPKA